MLSPSFRTQSLSLLRSASRICTSGSEGLVVPLLPSAAPDAMPKRASVDDVRDDWRMVKSGDGEKTTEAAFGVLVATRISGALALACMPACSMGLVGAVCVEDMSAGGGTGAAEGCWVGSSGFTDGCVGISAGTKAYEYVRLRAAASGGIPSSRCTLASLVCPAAPPNSRGAREQFRREYSPSDMGARQAAAPEVDVKEREGFWMQGGEGYIRFEGKCSPGASP